MRQVNLNSLVQTDFPSCKKSLYRTSLNIDHYVFIMQTFAVISSDFDDCDGPTLSAQNIDRYGTQDLYDDCLSSRTIAQALYLADSKDRETLLEALPQSEELIIYIGHLCSWIIGIPSVYLHVEAQDSFVHCAHDNSMIEHIAFTKATEGSYCYALLVLFVGEDGSEPLITWLGFGAEPRLISVSSPSPELNIWVFLLHCTLSWSIHLTLDPNYPYWAVIHVDLLACCIE